MAKYIKSAVEKRKKNREKKTDKANKIAEEILRELVPGLFKDEIDTSLYDSQIPFFESEAVKRLKTPNAVAIAILWCARFIEKGNRENKWQLDPLPAISRIMNRTPLRTRGFVKDGNSLIRHDMAIMDSLDPTQKLDNLALLGANLYMAITRSGLCIPEAVEALARQLTTSKPIHQRSWRLWCELTFASKKRATNVLEADDCKTSIPWYPSDHCLGLLTKFLKLPLREREFLRQENKKLAWNALKHFYKVVIGSKPPLKSLKKMCWVAPCVIERMDGIRISEALFHQMIGRTASVSLPSSYRIQETQTQPLQVIPLKLCQRQKNLPSWKNNKADFRAMKLQIRHILKATGPSNLVTDKKHIAEKLKQFADSNAKGTCVEALLLWYQDVLIDNVPNTALRYHGEIFDYWVSLFAEVSASKVSGEDFYHLYKELLAIKKEGRPRNYLAGRLAEFHDFAVQNLGYEELPEPIRPMGIYAPHVRSGYVDHKVFLETLDVVRSFNDEWAPYRKQLELLCVLAYRTGLRIGELLHLQIKDFQDIKGNGNWVVNVRHNIYRFLKSNNSERRIYLSPLLNKTELELLQSRLFGKNDEGLLFHAIYDPSMPLDPTSVSLKIGSVLKHVSGILEMVFHHFRHTAFSNLQILLEKEFWAFEKMAGYTKEQALKIHRSITGNEYVQRDIYHLLARFAGHASPETTFLSYFHFNDLLVHLKIRHTQDSYSLATTRYLTGLSVSNIKEVSGQGTAKCKFKIRDFRPRMLEKLAPYVVSEDKTCDGIVKESVIIVTPDKLKLDLELTIDILRQLNLDSAVEQIAFSSGLDTKEIQLVKNVALEARKLKTRIGGKFRLDQNSYGPKWPSNSDERKLMLRICKHIIKKFDGKTDQLARFAKHFLEKTNRHEKLARVYTPSRVRPIIEHLSLHLPEHFWELSLDLPKGKSDEFKSAAQEWWIQRLPVGVRVKTKENSSIRATSKYQNGIGYLMLQLPEKSSKGMRNADMPKQIAHLLYIYTLVENR
ncbi:site-specific integrase [Terasakiella pusilla]|uniref:site-specific integrase n=1 Tax=Terasakiella pusilla TaxID=64973 RepID=UPI003AA9422F